MILSNQMIQIISNERIITIELEVMMEKRVEDC